MSYGYNVRTERLRVLGLPELFAFLILIGVVCWMVFPRDPVSYTHLRAHET